MFRALPEPVPVVLQVVLVLPEPQPSSCPWGQDTKQDVPSLLTTGVLPVHVVHVPGVVAVSLFAQQIFQISLFFALQIFFNIFIFFTANSLNFKFLYFLHCK